MRSSHHGPGTVTLIGSGEMMRAMAKVHRRAVSRIEGPVRAVFLDTPAGFELNADGISQRAREYVEEYVGVPCSVATFKDASRATTRETESVLRKLRRANYIFAGPGSPTYAVRNWRNTSVFEQVAERVGKGAHLVLASAAAIAVGRYALPVYEVYKVGEAPHWIDGLDLLGPYGLDLAIVTHWNNKEGDGFDTRYCFMGQPRFDVLDELLPDSTSVLGIDEHTACILDLGRHEGSVMGAGQVTIRQKGREAKFEAGSSFDLDELRDVPGSREAAPQHPSVPEAAKKIEAGAGETLSSRTRRAEEALAASSGELPDYAEVAGRIYDLAQALEEAREAGVSAGLLSEGHATLDRLVSRWGSQVESSFAKGEGSADPLVELLIEVRARLRAAQHWELADEIRDRLSALGIVLEDDPKETTWRRR